MQRWEGRKKEQEKNEEEDGWGGPKVDTIVIFSQRS